MALKRLQKVTTTPLELIMQKELVELQKNPVESVDVSPVNDDLFAWQGSLVGPASSPYKGGKFKITMNFEPEYPFKPPNIKFGTKVYHPNVDDDGSICVGLLKSESWKPATKLSQVLRALYNLLEEPNPDDALQASIAEVYNKDRPRFEKTAAEVCNVAEL
jgi:ubiquitin-conjugating enzyme E2 D/E